MLKLSPSSKKLLKGASGVIALLLLIVPVFVLKNIRLAEEIGYFGFFLSSYFGGSTYLLPLLVTRLNPIFLLLIGTFGNTIDEFFGWYAGGLSVSLDEKTKLHKRVQNFVQKRGIVAIFVFGILPLPQFVYTISAFASGHYKIPLIKFLSVNFLGKFVRNVVYILILLYFLS